MFNFTVKEFILGGDTGTPTFQFYKKGFNLYGGSSGPSWQDIILSGNGSLTLTNAKANGLNYLKLFGGTEQTGTPTPDTPMDIVCNNGVVKARHASGLPLGYTLLEYIEFDGYSYIDTGITPLNSGATINMKIAPSTIANLQFLYGQNPTEGMQQVGCFLYTNGKISWQYSALRLTTNVVAVGTTYDITLGNGFITINGTTITGTPYTPFTTNMTVLVGAAWSPNYNYVDVRRFVGKVYAFSYKLGGQTLVNLVPAKNSSNVVGMYDLVSGQFFTNAGTGDFTAGDPVSDPVEIYTDGTQETVTVTGKNIFDKNTMDTQRGWYVSDTSTLKIGDVPSSNRTIVIDCKPNTKYSYWHTEGSGGVRAFDMSKDTIAVNDIANKWLGAPLIAEKNQVTTYTTSSTAKKLYILAGRKENLISRPFEDQLADFMVVEGEVTSATPYEPYYYGGSATAEMLLKVGNYQDAQSILDGAITRNVGVKVLDGTEKTGIQYGMFKVNAMLPVEKNSGWQARRLCSHGVAGAASATNNMIEVDGSTIWFGGKFITDMGWTTAEDGKAWIAQQYANGTPVIIVYALSTATTETVTPQPLSIQAGTNIVEITQASIDNLGLEVSYKATV